MASAFERLVAGLDYPLFVVTVAADGERAGCLIGFATQTSIDPPRFLACISKKNHTFPVAQRASALVVHVLSDDEKELAELFGGETGDEVDKFERCAWRPGPEGVPILDDATAWFAGRIVGRLDVGDHQGFLLAPFDADPAPPEEQLSFQQAKDIDPGHKP